MTEYDAVQKLKKLTGRLEELEEFLKKYKKLTEQCTNELGFAAQTQDVSKDDTKPT